MKNKLVYLLMIILAIVFGYLLGILCAGMDEPMVSWLGTSLDCKLDPATVDLHAFALTFGIRLSINPIQILFILLAIVISPKIAASIK